MLLGFGIEAPPTVNGASRRGWLIHEVVAINHVTEYRGFLDAESQTGTHLLRAIGAVEVCNRVPVTASYWRDRARERYPYTAQ